MFDPGDGELVTKLSRKKDTLTLITEILGSLAGAHAALAIFLALVEKKYESELKNPHLCWANFSRCFCRERRIAKEDDTGSK